MLLKENSKYESLRVGGTEILRVGKRMAGFENVSEKISNFYSSLAETSLAAAYERLTPIVKEAFEKAKSEGTRSVAFFRRFNYLISCSADDSGEGYLTVCVEVTLSRASEKIYSVCERDFWNISEQTLIKEKAFLRAVSKLGKACKK